MPKTVTKLLLILSFAGLTGVANATVEYVDRSAPNREQVELGRLLFHDKLLSGNLNTSCASCHHALADSGDGLSLPVGEGATGLGVTRDTGRGDNAVHERVPRNAPPIFMLGSVDVTHLFHDGRVEFDAAYPSGFKTPAGLDLPQGLDNILAAQAMFPVTSGTEMAGQQGENPIADAAASSDLHLVWQQLAARLQAIEQYVELFMRAFDDVDSAADISYVHAANAIAAFEIDAWRADNSPWDAYLAGQKNRLSKREKAGARLFFGKAGCGNCHSGNLFSDMRFHAIAMPQIGPGKGHGADGHNDFGRFAVTGDERDKYAFRTPPLRNVALTAPYGHAGAYDSLEDVVRHHLNPRAALWAYYENDACRSKPVMPRRADLDETDCVVMDDAARVQAIADAAGNYVPVSLKDSEVDRLLAFLHALTDRSNIDLRNIVPAGVPSGLTLAE